MAKFDWLMIFAFLFILLAGEFVAIDFYVKNINKCTQNPLEYYADNLKEANGDYLKVSGTVIILGKFNAFSIPFGDVENKSYSYTPLTCPPCGITEFEDFNLSS